MAMLGGALLLASIVPLVQAPAQAQGAGAATPEARKQPAPPADRAGAGISGGLPAMSGITPSRAELPSSAFTKLDGQQRGYLTREDVGQLDGFEASFRRGDQNGDGRLTAAEFEAAWSHYSGSAR